MRRKGVPCGCTDNGGCCGLKEKLAILWDRTIGSILKINNQTPDGDGNFAVQGGDNIEVSNISNGIEIGLKNPLTDDVTVQADLTVDGDIVANGDIIQNGQAYETHAEKIYTNDDYIVMREGAVGPLASGDYSGFQVKKYDGINDGRLVIDRDGTARVGDVGDEQPLATRDESADMTDGEIVQWDATGNKLVTSGKTVNDIAGLDMVAEGTPYINVTGYEGTEITRSITLPTGVTFEDGYDYFLFMHANPTANVAFATDTVTKNSNVLTFTIQADQDFTLTYGLYRSKTESPLAGTLLRIFASDMVSTRDQPKLVSGVNIKTVGGQSILGSGNIPAGGLTWTQRTANDDWSDMFEVVNSNIHVKKHVYMYMNAFNCHASVYIPKDLTVASPLRLAISSTPSVGVDRYSIWDSIRIRSQTITDSSFDIYYSTISFATDGSTVTLSKNTNIIQSFGKSNLNIYTSD